MKHYRILEFKYFAGAYKKQYIVQYLKKFIFGLYFWKKLNDNFYDKYEDAFNEVKKIISQDDYDTPELGYHYIDAYKVFKYNTPGSVKEVKEIKDTTVATTTITTPTTSSKLNKSTFVQSDPNRKKVNKSIFIPKQK